MFYFLQRKRKVSIGWKSDELFLVHLLLVPNQRCWLFDLSNVYCKVCRLFRKLYVSNRVLDHLSRPKENRSNCLYRPNSKSRFVERNSSSNFKLPLKIRFDSYVFAIVRRKLLPFYLWRTRPTLCLDNCFLFVHKYRWNFSRRFPCEQWNLCFGEHFLCCYARFRSKLDIDRCSMLVSDKNCFYLFQIVYFLGAGEYDHWILTKDD